MRRFHRYFTEQDRVVVTDPEHPLYEQVGTVFWVSRNGTHVLFDNGEKARMAWWRLDFEDEAQRAA